jgi:hypothetical protein
MVSLLAVERGLSPLQAFEAVMGFARLRGECSLSLALHASVPQVLHIDMLQVLRLNFVDAINPEVTVNDVLFATFCVEMGNGYFRFDDNARIQLLQQFESGNPDSSSGQAVRVADFLLTYLGRELTSDRCDRDPVYRSWLEIERWNALAFRDPEATAEQLAAAVKQACDPAHASARLRVGTLATSLATPLASHHRLLRYVAGLEALRSQAAMQIGSIPTGQSAVNSLIKLKNGELISGGADGSLRRWKDGKAVGQPIATGQGGVRSLVELKNGELISGGDDGSLQRWNDGKAVVKAACEELREHPALLEPQTAAEKAARETCRSRGLLK